MSRLNYHHLHYFWAVASEGHLTRAAERLHVSQSALSAQIRQLEEQLGQPLFLREGRKLQLTELGAVVMRYAEEIFALGNELLATAASGQGRGTLRIGSVATLSRNFQEWFLQPVLKEADVRLVLESGSLDELLQRLKAHELDVVLSNRPALGDDKQSWRCRTLARQPVVLVGPPRPEGRTFQFERDLPALPLLVPSRKSEIRLRFDLLCEELALQPAIRAEVDDMAMLRLLARDAGCVALLPAIVVRDELGKGLLQQYCVVPRVEETFYAITVQRQYLPPLLQDLLRMAADDQARSLAAP
ncbi:MULTISPECIES: LysR family transcriptional regulator [Chromobacterium]|uniref:Na(+)/H(+) antiporter regulatory protein n=2 Tax=Chromobacterium violaceum TaxID=536 RepID=A0AAX2M6B5_CHRVL|nr:MULTISPECIES: LysR family transcriptional regulator [Chromobacterium]AAQ60888.1 probable transcriptional regulator, LysR family [Chromobacterium violaceum ATCC 12472]KMN47282.1 LysR family transcriptional regulator [Chromobacterium violaceum]KMN85990.1 LysR family transcriptional regulator [Chromobacterium violaceum]KMN88373.1 LysR family transcriptional regulator [Chromobacterium violaceum]KMO02840.1 LysR family transcriptional regulator [Chromobacterium violaceum]